MGNAKGRFRFGSLLAPALIAVALAALAGFGPPVAVAAEAERVLDPRLSLVGGCKEEALDPVEDPGCPATPPPGAHPPSTFLNPKAVATDDYGNIYVSSFGTGESGAKGRIDIFCSDGTFISELVLPGATSMAIDSEGNLYTYANPSPGTRQILRLAPDLGYDPEACDIGYGTPPVSVLITEPAYSGLAINRDNDHLFADLGTPGVVEFNAADEGNEVVRTSPGPSWGGGNGMAVDAARDRMYASAGTSEERIDIFDLNTVIGTPPEDKYEKVGSILPTSVPAKDFGTQLSVAVNEGNGHVFLLDGENCHLYEFEADGTYLGTIPTSFLQCTFGPEIGIDNGPFSPNGKLSEEAGRGRYLYVPSHKTGTGHSFAFFESSVGPAEVSSIAAANISETEAELQAEIDPNNLETAYSFEFISEQAATKNEEEAKEAFAGATLAGEGTIAAGNLPEEVTAPATGLSPGTSYRFRVIATNEEEPSDEAVGSFTTYPSVPTETGTCPNALLRTGPSALLPDCRAYELVTPADTNGRAPLGAELGNLTRQVSPAGDKVPFRVEGGSLPGLGGTGSLLGDPYLVTRTPGGWSTAYIGPTASEATVMAPETTSPDQGYSFYRAEVSGSAVIEGFTSYVRYPDGHAEILGHGSLGKIDPQAVGQLITEGGTHIVFATGILPAAPVQLEPEAAPDGTKAVYDRTPDGVTHVVSLKPDGSSFGGGESAGYQGASADGEGIAFRVTSNNTLYLRYQNKETFQIGTGVDFAGVAEGGTRIFYVEGGNLKAFDVEGEVVTDFSTTGDVTPVTVAEDGTTAYFVSESVLGGANPQGDEAQAGEQNLYRSVEGQVDFIGTVTERDVEGKKSPTGDGLGLWVESIGPPGLGRLGAVPARSTPDGQVFLFKSRAALTDYDSEDQAEIYRYDAEAGELACISCIPTGTPASSDASLQSEEREGGAELFSALAWPENLRADGRRAFFESGEALVAADGDGLQDVYEWEDEGVGSCTKPGGCVYLISSPQSSRDEYLWAVSASGDDVFFLSSELLTGADSDGTPSIYDARVGGGFAEEAVSECQGEGCRPTQQPVPPTPTILTPILGPGDQAKPPKTCPRGKHKVKSKSKVRCVKNKKPHKNQGKKSRAAGEQKGGRR